MTLRSHKEKTVLVVDDDSGVRSLLFHALTHDGYNVIEAADGVAALDILGGAHRVDLLLTDVQMPRLGGCELLIAARKILPELPVILISGAVDVGSAPFQRLAECFDVRAVIEKPFDPSLILIRVRTAIGHPTGIDEL
jgi:CheY-like chemotaxis protein